MADQAISALSGYTTVHNDDLFVLVDVHDTSMAPSGTDKKATYLQVAAAISGMIGITPILSIVNGGTGAGTASGARTNLSVTQGKYTFGVYGTPTLSGVTPPVYLPNPVTCNGIWASCGTSPTGSGATIIIQNGNNGVTWSSLVSVTINSGSYFGTSPCTTLLTSGTYLRGLFSAINNVSNMTAILYVGG